MQRTLRILLMASLALGLGAPSCSQQWQVDDDTPAASLLGLGVGPDSPRVTVGDLLQLRARGFYSDTTSRDLTDTVAWHSDDEVVLSVSSALDSEGLATPLAAGSAQVWAERFGIVSNELRVTVTEATMESLQLAPAQLELHVGESAVVTAEALFSDGSTGNASGSVRWGTSRAAVATVTGGGEIEGRGVGQAEVRGLVDLADSTLESNPCAVTVVAGGVIIEGPDVVFDHVSAAVDGSRVSWQASLRNVGVGSAGGFYVDAWLHRSAAPPAPPTSGDARVWIEGLDPGLSLDASLELDDVAPGIWSSWLALDTFGSLDEGTDGEANNHWGPEQVVVEASGGPIGPDLSITWLQAFARPAQGRVVYVADVSNTGDEASGKFSLGLFANAATPPAMGEAPDLSTDLPSLGPGETASVSLAYETLPASPWLSWLVADVGGEVIEADETNNHTSVAVPVP